MAVKKYGCNNVDCYASDLNDNCILKNRKWFGYCGDYYPKIKSSDNEIFSHLFHKHNLKTRYFSIIAIIISMIAIVFTCYITVSSNIEKVSIEESLRNIGGAMIDIKNNIKSRNDVDLKGERAKTKAKPSEP